MISRIYRPAQLPAEYGSLPRVVSYRALNPDEVERTVGELHQRITERFPGSSLSKVANELFTIAKQAKERAYRISQPILGFRVFVGVFILSVVLVAAYTSSTLKLPEKEFGITDLVQLLDSALNDIVITAAALFSLVTFETRIKRKRALAALHVLRSVAHIIDMHQLTKDPQRVRYTGVRTPSSPDEPMNAFELGRYLDYCSELLALTGKIAALYGDHFDDEVVLSAVNDIETLTTGLSRKIWQKLMILQALPAEAVIA